MRLAEAARISGPSRRPRAEATSQTQLSVPFMSGPAGAGAVTVGALRTLAQTYGTCSKISTAPVPWISGWLRPVRLPAVPGGHTGTAASRQSACGDRWAPHRAAM